jgi:sirohydrochlorin cobaltochelatase
LIGHGTRDELGNDEFLSLAKAIAADLSPIPAVTCYLELRQPDILVGLRELHARGADEIVVAPLLLFDARHALEDIPGEASEFLDEHPDVKLRYAGALGRHPKVMELALDRARAVAGHRKQTFCIVVVRGTSNVAAQRTVRELVEEQRPALETLFGQATEVSLAYVAAADPRLKDAIATAVAAGARRIVLLPHILFHGEVLTEIRHLANETAASHPEIEVLVADHLGAGLLTGDQHSKLLIEAFLDRIQEALSLR